MEKKMIEDRCRRAPIDSSLANLSFCEACGTREDSLCPRTGAEATFIQPARTIARRISLIIVAAIVLKLLLMAFGVNNYWH